MMGHPVLGHISFHVDHYDNEFKVVAMCAYRNVILRTQAICREPYSSEIYILIQKQLVNELLFASGGLYLPREISTEINASFVTSTERRADSALLKNKNWKTDGF